MKMFENFQYELKDGMSKNEIAYIEKEMNWTLPKFYKDILQYSDGLELDDGDINLFGSDYIREANIDTYSIDKFMPGYLVIGDTGGGNVLIVEQKEDKNRIYVYESGTLCINESYMEVENIEKWFLDKCPIEKNFYHKIY